MNRLEELTLKLADEVLTEAEARALESLLAADSAATTAHLGLLQLEAALRGQRETLDLAGSTLTALRSGLAASVEQGVMQQLAAEPPPAWATPRSRRRAEADLNVAADVRKRSAEGKPDGLGKSASLPRRLRPTWNRPMVLALAAAVVIFVGLGVWLFGPTMGRPMLADVQGVEVSIQRGTELLPAANGMVLHAADVLHIGTNASATLAFGAEKTRLELSDGTEMELTSLPRGKRFELTSGKITASVAHQRPFQPMIITTPQAEARVLGTEFSLLTTPNETRLEVTEGKVRFTRASDRSNVQVSAGNYAVATSNSVLAALPLTGRVFREYWTNIIGDSWTDLITNTNYPDRPDGSGYLTNLSIFEMPSNWADNYGERLRGFVHPPKTGEYTFWIAGRNDGSLYLSPDDNPENKVHMAHSGGAAPGDWQNDAAQQSASVSLTAGKKYYFEVMHKAGVGDDSLVVAWQGPGQKREVIPGEFLSPFKPKGQK